MVKAVDLKTRTVTLVGPQGEDQDAEGRRAGEEPGEVKPGATVIVHYESAAYVIVPPGMKLPENAMAMAEEQAVSGELPAGGAAAKIIVTGLVVGLNSMAHDLSGQSSSRGGRDA